MPLLRLFCLAAALAAANASYGQVPTRLDYCQADPLSRRVADATALMVPRAQLSHDPITDTYNLTTAIFDYSIGTAGNLSPICPDEPYYHQIRAVQGRTGFLIGKRTLMTAPHFASFDPANYAVIFNWRWDEDGAQPSESPDRDCTLPFDPDAIPASNVYFLDEEGTRPYNTKEHDSGNPADYMIFHLDRAVTGITPLPLRRSGQPLLGDPLLIPGYPETLPLKIVGGGRVERVGPGGIAIGEPWIGAGSSGSPIFNLRAELVEGVVARAFSGKFWRYDTTSLCYREIEQTTLAPPRLNNNNNAPITVIPSGQIPVTGALSVAPLNLVRHVVAGNSATNAVSSFEVSLPATAPASVDYTVGTTHISPEPGHTPANWHLDPPAGTYTATPGSSRRFTATLNQIPSECSAIDTEIRITPLTAGMFASVIPHRFEVEQSDFTVTPDVDWTLTAFAPPYPTRVLTIRNPSPVAQDIDVTSSAAWLLVDGMASSSVSLAAAGSPGDSATVTLSITSTADLDVPPGTSATGLITAVPTDTRCLERGAEEIAVNFTNGVLEHEVTDTSLEPLSYPTGGSIYGAPRAYAFKLADYAGETVADVDVAASFYELGNMALVPAALKIELETPNPTGLPPGHLMLLWDADTAPSGYWNEISDVHWLRLDDETTPPLQTPLSDADGEDMGGAWKVRLFNNSSNDIVPYKIRLRIVRTP